MTEKGEEKDKPKRRRKGRRRSAGEGSVYPEGNGWRAAVTYHDEDGIEHTITRRAKTEREALEKKMEVLLQLAQGLPIVPAQETVASFAQRWLRDVVKPNRRATAYRFYEGLLRLYIVPALGKEKLARLRAPRIQTFYRRLQTEMGKKGKPLSDQTRLHVHRTLHALLQQALKWRLVARNEAGLTETPGQPDGTSLAITAEQVIALFEAARADRLGALFVLAATSAMREGELRALRWRDVDLERGELMVTATLPERPDQELGWVWGPPKSKDGNRKLHLTSLAVEALRAQREQQAQEREAAGAAWQDYDLVFASTMGTPLRESNIRRRHLLPILQRAGLGHMRFYDLRHTTATLLGEAGETPQTVKQIMGHSDIGITVNRYTHVFQNRGRQAAAALDELLKQAGTPSETTSATGEDEKGDRNDAE